MCVDMQHVPVLAAEVIAGLDLKPGAIIIDGTLGLGGHTALILERTAPDGKVIGIDRDARNLELAREQLAKYGGRVRYVHSSFSAMNTLGVEADGVLLDLGFSSVHVDAPERGFSFQNDGPLDMRYDTQGELTAEDIVNGWSKDDLATILRRFGEEPAAHRIAKAIFDARREQRITTTLQLAEIISAIVPRRGKAHPATKTFQALRLVVNDELGEVEKGLQAAQEVLKPGGILAVITFHSLEDRLVKHWLKEHLEFESLSKKPIAPGRAEVLSNPRSRSAKLRLAKKR
ncbi:MAG: rRNA (cytosine1402-N4)-methyltransferase [Patescibacteria group bacterium]|nr:rRNA (cytosine1402-N4)-methyltransferase [Patescibacteria group bacterium]